MDILVDVPPISMKTPCKMCEYNKAPATLAAGPDNIVKIGLFLNVSISVTPPSPFIIIIGHDIFSFLTASSTYFAVLIAFGIIPALIAAVNVLISNP